MRQVADMGIFGWLKTPIKKIDKEESFDIDFYARLNKPFDATHYVEYGKDLLSFLTYYKFVGGRLYYWSRIYEEWEVDLVRKPANFKRKLKEF